MEQQINEQTLDLSQMAEIEEKSAHVEKQDGKEIAQQEISESTSIENKSENKEEVSLGKFKDVKSLIQAYNSLQAEFTKRCQRIKELEGETKAVDKAIAPTEQVSVEKEKTQTGITEEDRIAILQDYLKGVVSLKQKAVIMDGEGTGVKTPTQKPKTLAEASALAREILK